MVVLAKLSRLDKCSSNTKALAIQVSKSVIWKTLDASTEVFWHAGGPSV